MLSGGITKGKGDSTGTRLETPRQHSGVGTSGPEGVFTPATPGPVADPSVDSEAHINIPNYGDDTKSDTHSHPSGTKSVTTGGGANTIGGTQTTNSSFRQAPSSTDVSNAGTNSNYVFGRGNGTVYIYNNTGVQATIPQKYFVTPRR